MVEFNTLPHNPERSVTRQQVSFVKDTAVFEWKGNIPHFYMKGTVYNDFMRCLMFSEERVERDVSISLFAKWFIHSRAL